MTDRKLYLELLESLFSLKGWKNQSVLEIKEHQEEADVILFQLSVEGIDDKEMGIIMKERGVNNKATFEDFLGYQPFFIEGIKILSLMQASSNFKEFESLDKKRKKNSKKPVNVVDFDTVMLALMKIPKSELIKKEKRGTK